MGISALSTLLAGMRTQGARLATIAENIANFNTPGYRSKPVSSSPDTTSSSSSENPEISNVDLAEQFVHLKETEVAYKADAAMVKVEDDLSKSILDILA